nr:MAG TPA: hypothetical protein [Caudoviricetes sp.]
MRVPKSTHSGVSESTSSYYWLGCCHAFSPLTLLRYLLTTYSGAVDVVS